jgi:branched-chain amino acid transport system permease protein
VVGVFVFEVLKEWMSSKTPYWYGILGLVFIVATIYLPRGIVGELQRMATRARPGAAHGAQAQATLGAAAEESSR